jgi:hypothetical protein
MNWVTTRPSAARWPVGVSALLGRDSYAAKTVASPDRGQASIPEALADEARRRLIPRPGRAASCRRESIAVPRNHHRVDVSYETASVRVSPPAAATHGHVPGTGVRRQRRTSRVTDYGDAVSWPAGGGDGGHEEVERSRGGSLPGKSDSKSLLEPRFSKPPPPAMNLMSHSQALGRRCRGGAGPPAPGPTKPGRTRPGSRTTG